MGHVIELNLQYPGEQPFKVECQGLFYAGPESMREANKLEETGLICIKYLPMERGGRPGRKACNVRVVSHLHIFFLGPVQVSTKLYYSKATGNFQLKMLLLLGMKFEKLHVI